MFIAWGIGIGLFTWLFGSWEDKQLNPNQSPESFRSQGAAEVTLQRNRFGHYMATGKVNYQEALFMLDTGATYVAVPANLQKKLGLIAGQVHYTSTANGTSKAYTTIIDQLAIGEIELHNVRASILPGMQGEEILLGMSVLKQLEFSQKGDRLTLRQTL